MGISHVVERNKNIWADMRHYFFGNNENKKRFGYLMLGIGFAVFLSAIILPFPLVLTGTISVVGFSIISSFTIVGFIILLIGVGVLSTAKDVPASTPSKNNVELKSDSMDLSFTDIAVPNKTPVNIRAQEEKEAFFKAESARLAKYRDIANILDVSLIVPSLGFWQSQPDATPKITLLLASKLAHKGHEQYKTDSRFEPYRTVAEEVAMALANPKNSNVKSEIIAELIKLDLYDFTKERKDKLIDTLNRGEKLLQYCEEVSNRNAEAFCEHIRQTPWSTT